MVCCDADSLAERIGYRFSRPELLELALRHRSWVSDRAAAGEEPPESNERLELLGDAVLDVVVSDFLYRRRPSMAVGELAKTRASVVSADSLAVLARDLNLGPAVLLGRSEEAAGGCHKRSILADAAEALIGAVYLDGGWEAARRVVLDHLADQIESEAQNPGGDDYKTVLQERVAREGAGAPAYRLTYTGPDHERVYRAVVSIGGRDHGTGEGPTKKKAEQQAARDALAEG